MTETVELCEHCESSQVVRVPSTFSSPIAKPTRSTKVGDITKEFIESSREDLKTQKEGLNEKR
jgi:hypothetical protein